MNKSLPPDYVAWRKPYSPPADVRELALGLLGALGERDALILAGRHGLWDGRIKPLVELAAELKISRERVRQLQERAERKLKNAYLNQVRAFFSSGRSRMLGRFFSEREGMARKAEFAAASWGGGEAQLAFNFLRSVFEDKPGFYPQSLLASLPSYDEDRIVFEDSSAQERYDRGLSAVMAALEAEGKPMAAEAAAEAASRLTGTSISAAYVRRLAQVSMDIGMERSGLAGLRRWPYFDPKYIREMTHRALVDLGRPESPARIIERMNLLFPHRAPFRAPAVYRELWRNGGLFVRWGEGRYGLAVWRSK